MKTNTIRIKQLISALLILLPSCAPSFTYRHFLNERKQVSRAYDLREAGKYCQALSIYRKTGGGFARTSRYRGMAYCFKAAGKEDKALRSYRKAIRQGHRMDFANWAKDSVFLGNVWAELRRTYPRYRQRYLSGIDTALQRELLAMAEKDQSVRRELTRTSKRDSAYKPMEAIDLENERRLRQIAAKHGWPGEKILGSTYSTGMQGVDMVASLFIVHASEETNLYFLPIATKSATRHRASWLDPEAIMANLLWRFERKDGYVKMREVRVRKNGNLNERKSFFQIGTLAKMLTDNPDKEISMFATAYTAQEAKANAKNTNALRQIKRMLAEHGVAESRIHLSDSVRVTRDDELGTYKIAFCHVRKKAKNI
mgnify:CR=1 FL=1